MSAIKDLKLMEKAKLAEADVKTLKQEISLASKKMFEISMKKELGELKQTHLIKELRRYIATAKTFVNEKSFNVN